LLVLIFCFLISMCLGIYYIIKTRSYGVINISFISVLLKLILGVLGVYIALPFSGTDAKRFEMLASYWSEMPITEILVSIDVTGSYVISSLTAIMYALIEKNIAIPVFVNVSIAILVFFLALKLANRVWNDHQLNGFFALVLALHPIMNVNSAVVLRETYIYFFVVLASLSIVNFAWTHRVRYATLFLMYVLLASFFHGAMLLMALGLPIYALIRPGLGFWKKLLLAGFIFFIFILVFQYFDFSKLKSITDGSIFGVEYFQDIQLRRKEANTVYLPDLIPTNFFDLVWQTPIRILFLLVKPLPWDIQSFGHFLAFTEAMIWWLIIFLFIKNWSIIRRNPACLALLCISAVALIAFSYGTSNFGTGIRHRAKFFVIAWVIIYPFLPRFTFRRMKKS